MSAHSRAQSLLFINNGVVFNNDTLNKKDAEGKLNGPGIYIYTDSSVTHFINGSSIEHSCFIDSAGDNNCLMSVIEGKDSSWTEIKQKVCGSGEFVNNQKEGIWKYSSKCNLDKIDALVTYRNDSILNVQLFSSNGKIWSELVYTPTGWHRYTFKNEERVLTRTIKNIDMDQDNFLIPPAPNALNDRFKNQ